MQGKRCRVKAVHAWLIESLILSRHCWLKSFLFPLKPLGGTYCCTLTTPAEGRPMMFLCT